jgi:hypothetical protein
VASNETKEAIVVIPSGDVMVIGSRLVYDFEPRHQRLGASFHSSRPLAFVLGGLVSLQSRFSAVLLVPGSLTHPRR